jgi:serine/threonine-protein kinase
MRGWRQVTDPLLGRRLGKYELQGLLGQGGMARVYRALDHVLQREVAFKVLTDAGQDQAEFAERFQREAQMLASMRHPHIVQVYTAGRQDGISYIVQELLPGPTLDQELRDLAAQGRVMDHAEVQRVVAQLADALDYAHGRGIVHRDLKPSNLIRNERGDVVLTDFGIAKSLTGTLNLTQAGIVMGTPNYLAPEQAMGGMPPTPATDIYAFGVILFELLTGRVPFDEPTPMGVILGHLYQPPPSPHSMRPELPPAVEQVVLAALAKEPSARPPTAGAVAAALATAWPRPTATAPRPTTPLPLQPAPPQDVHQMQTLVNPALARAPRPAASAPVPPPADRPPASPRAAVVAPSSPAAAARPRRWPLAVGGLLLLALLGGAALRARDSLPATASQPTALPAAATAGAAPAPAPTAGAAPAPLATQPTAVPAPASPQELLGQISATIDQAVAGQQLDRKTGDDWQKKITEAQKKIDEGKLKEAGDKVKELQRKIGDALKQNKISSDVAAQLSAMLAAINLSG